jgi:hypothetical protein
MLCAALPRAARSRDLHGFLGGAWTEGHQPLARNWRADAAVAAAHAEFPAGGRRLCAHESCRASCAIPTRRRWDADAGGRARRGWRCERSCCAVGARWAFTIWVRGDSAVAVWIPHAGPSARVAIGLPARAAPARRLFHRGAACRSQRARTCPRAGLLNAWGDAVADG